MCAATLGALRFSQILYRGRKVIRSAARAAAPELCRSALGLRSRSAPPSHGRVVPAGAPFLHKERAQQQAAGLLAGKACFLGRSRPLRAPVDWAPAGADLLWSYQLHAFEYLEAMRWTAQQRPQRASSVENRAAELIDDWIMHHRFPDRPGWDPYPLSLRLVYWGRFLGERPAARTPSRMRSVYEQMRILLAGIEDDLANNHVIENLAGILFAASLFAETPEIRRIRAFASWRLGVVLREQLRSDGALAERSAVYHGLVLCRLLMLRSLQRLRLAAVPGLEDRISRMAEAMGDFLLPDGGTFTFNDSAEGLAPAPELLLTSAGRATGARTNGTGAADRGGFARYTTKRYGCVVDCEGPAPSHNPGHSHAAIGAFVLYWGKTPLVVDPGCSTYQRGPVRRFERSTAAHNTPAVDGRDQSEMWGIFRVGRRARAEWRWIESPSGGIVLEVSHDGYRRLPAPVTHRRRFFFGRTAVVLSDMLVGRGRHRTSMLLTFAPGTELAPAPTGWTVSGKGISVAVYTFGWSEARPVRTHTAREFGRRRETAGLELSCQVRVPWQGVTLLAKAGGPAPMWRGDRVIVGRESFELFRAGRASPSGRPALKLC